MSLTRRAMLKAGLVLSAFGCGGRSEPSSPSASSSVVPTAEVRRVAVDDVRWLGRVRDRLADAHALRPPPKPGEWLADHPEPGQRLEGFWAARPTRVSPSRRTLVVQPVGSLGPAHVEILSLVNAYLALHFGLETRVAPEFDPGPPPKGASRERFGSTQLLTRWFLDDLLPKRVPADAAALLAFVEADLFPDATWNYVFGEASFDHPVGVWSLHRYGDPSASKTAFDLALMRALKIAVHETGHMFGLPHCTLYRCVQSGTNSLEETDASPLWLCPDCLPKVAWVTRTDPRDHLRKTAAFCRARGFEKDADVAERHLEIVDATG